MNKAVCVLFGFALLFASDAFAQSIWSANAATGVPNFLSTGDIKTTTVDTTIHGRGVRPRMTSEGTGTSFVYIPVTAPQGSNFACVGLRAMDTASDGGTMRAEFWRQPRNANAGPAVLLGAVSSVNAAGDGFQFQQAAFGAQVINYNLFTYYIRLNMYHQPSAAGAIASVIALDVSLSQYCATF